jgi:hypothetical protein
VQQPQHRLRLARREALLLHQHLVQPLPVVGTPADPVPHRDDGGVAHVAAVPVAVGPGVEDLADGVQRPQAEGGSRFSPMPAKVK